MMKISLFLLYSIAATGTVAIRPSIAASSEGTAYHYRRSIPKAQLPQGVKRSPQTQQKGQVSGQCEDGRLRKRGQCLSSPTGQDRNQRLPTAGQRNSASQSPQNTNPSTGSSSRGPDAARRRSASQNTRTQQPIEQQKQLKIKMKADEEGQVRAIVDEEKTRHMGPWQKTLVFDPREGRLVGNGPQSVIKKHPSSNIIGQAISSTGGRITSKIRAPEIRADVATAENGESAVKIQDPSRRFYPSGRHVETVRGDTSKIFRAASDNPRAPAKLKVTTKDRGATQLEGTTSSGRDALHHQYGLDRHRLPDDVAGHPALISSMWTSQETGGGDIARG